MSSRSLRLEPFAFQSFQISSETFLEPSARGVKILLVLLLTASGDKWWSWTRGFGAKASRTSGIWSQTGSWIPAKGSGTPSGITGWAFRLPSSLEYGDLSKLSGKRSWRFSCWLFERRLGGARGVTTGGDRGLPGFWFPACATETTCFAIHSSSLSPPLLSAEPSGALGDAEACNERCGEAMASISAGMVSARAIVASSSWAIWRNNIYIISDHSLSYVSYTRNMGFG